MTEDTASGHPTPTGAWEPVRIEDPIERPIMGQSLGRYQLLRCIGEGGMGTVYEAEHTEIGRRVALKILRPRFLADPESVSRFFKEALAVNRIKHPGIIQIFDAVESPHATYLVMELLQGQSLRERIDCSGPLSSDDVRLFGAAMADALATVHDAGIVHRDLKPENIFLEDKADGTTQVRVLDFGIAKLTGLEQYEGLTDTADGIVVGTPTYMAPEQASASLVDARSDIYTFGAVLYEALTGRPPFQASNVGQFLIAHLTEVPEAPSRHNPAVTPELDALILRCLEKVPEHRPSSMNKVRNILLGDDALSVPNFRAPPPMMLPVETDPELTPATGTRLKGLSPSELAPHNRLPFAALLVALGMAIAVVGVAVGIQRNNASASEPALAPLTAAGGQGFGPVHAAGRASATPLDWASDVQATLNAHLTAPDDSATSKAGGQNSASEIRVPRNVGEKPSRARRLRKASAPKVAAPNNPSIPSIAPAVEPKSERKRPEARTGILDPFGQ